MRWMTGFRFEEKVVVLRDARRKSTVEGSLEQRLAVIEENDPVGDAADAFQLTMDMLRAPLRVTSSSPVCTVTGSTDQSGGKHVRAASFSASSRWDFIRW